MLSSARSRLGRLSLASALAATAGYGWSSSVREDAVAPHEGEAEARRRAVASTSSASTSLREDGESLLVLARAVKNIIVDVSGSLGSSVSGRVAQVLTALSSQPALVDAMLSSNDEQLVRWLLDQLDKPAECAERRGAEVVLAQMLAAPSSARLLLSHSDLFPCLLDHVVRNEFSDISGALKVASGAIVLGSPSSPQVVRSVLNVLLESQVGKHQGSSLSHICCWALSCWAKQEDSRPTLLGLGALGAISEVLGRGPSLEDEDRALLLGAAFDLLSHQTGRLGEDETKNLLTPIIHNGAHAVANLDEDLLACAINCLASLLETGAILGDEMAKEVDSIALLLKLVSKTFFIEADLCKDSLRAALARFLRASASRGGEVRVVDEEIWIPRLMSWLFCSSKPRKFVKHGERGDSSDRVRLSSLEAVAALMGASDEGFGVRVAREWLAHFGLALCEHHEREAAKYERGGATIGMLEERVREARDAVAELLSACRNATITAVHPPKLPKGVEEVNNANLPEAYAAAAARVDEAMAVIAAAKVMSALGDLLSDDRASQEWFLKSGALGMLHKITSAQQQAGEAGGDAVQLSTGTDGALSRLLAILSVHGRYKEEIGSSTYEGWLQRLSGSANCRIRSNAERALLNSRSKPSGSGKCLEVRDGVHLLVPGAEHHLRLVESCNSGLVGKECGIEADIVFVHGLNGGPFSSWRPGTEKKAKAEGKQSVWPQLWLAKTNPNLRLLSLEYKTKVFDYEGAQHSFRELTSEMLKKLSAAGVGQRPVIFVTHSMGGLMVKEMMMQGAEKDDEMTDKSIQDIVKNTKGVVFYSTPHHGSWLASASWNLLYIRGLKDIVDVLRPGPYLEELNEFFKTFCKAQHVPVLSFSESTQTHLMGPSIVKAEIVPAESAYPGFGEFHMVESDHIGVCKPLSNEDPSYLKVERFIKTALNP